jgi:hypothetical protein
VVDHRLQSCRPMQMPFCLRPSLLTFSLSECAEQCDTGMRIGEKIWDNLGRGLFLSGALGAICGGTLLGGWLESQAANAEWQCYPVGAIGGAMGAATLFLFATLVVSILDDCINCGVKCLQSLVNSEAY